MTSIYFSGGAFGFIYYLGVLKAIYEQNRLDETIYGISAGAFLVMYYALRIDNNILLSQYKEIKELLYSKILAGQCDYTWFHIKMFDYIVKEFPDAYLQCNGKIKIGITDINKNFKWIDTFSSNYDLFNAILCSCHLPFLCDYDAKINNVLCVDGGYSFDVLRDLPNDTFKITLGSLENNELYDLNANIPLYDCLLPPSDDNIILYYNRGYNEMMNPQSYKYVPSLSSYFKAFVLNPETSIILRKLQNTRPYKYDLEKYKN